MKPIFFILLILTLLPISFAAISTPFLENDVINLERGETYDYEIQFQNPTSEPLTLQFVTKIGDEYLSPNAFTVELPPNGKETRVISVSASNHPETYIMYSVIELSGGDGNIPLGTEVEKEFLVVSEERKNQVFTILFFVNLGVLCVIAIVIYFNYMEGRKKHEE